MKILIVANGCIKNTEWYKPMIEGCGKVIAADGGADNCIKLGIIPDYIIGDMDSITAEAKKKFSASKIIEDKDQDKTDLQLAIRLAESLRPENITVIGATGERLDHTIGNVLSLADSESDIMIIDENNEVYSVNDSIEIHGRKGDIVSVIAVSEVSGLAYEGLRWELKNKDVHSGWMGVCNEMNGDSAKISVTSGKIIVIKSRDG
ncbi:MAG: thiamine diphosphokinase [Candidatus Aenigmarchaeota archaeon]|nr:thiamine diphosphokinase [Candidatus Aenigmarchaeota archaeon]